MDGLGSGWGRAGEYHVEEKVVAAGVAQGHVGASAQQSLDGVDVGILDSKGHRGDAVARDAQVGICPNGEQRFHVLQSEACQ